MPIPPAAHYNRIYSTCGRSRAYFWLATLVIIYTFNHLLSEPWSERIMTQITVFRTLRILIGHCYCCYLLVTRPGHVSRVTCHDHPSSCRVRRRSNQALGHALMVTCLSFSFKEGRVIHPRYTLSVQIIYLPSKLNDVPRSDVSSSSLCAVPCIVDRVCPSYVRWLLPWRLCLKEHLRQVLQFLK